MQRIWTAIFGPPRPSVRFLAKQRRLEITRRHEALIARSWQTWVALLIFVAGFGAVQSLHFLPLSDWLGALYLLQPGSGVGWLAILMGLLFSLPFIVGAVLLGRTGQRCYRMALSEQGICPACGYDLTGNISGVCPECGTRVQRRSDVPSTPANPS